MFLSTLRRAAAALPPHTLPAEDHDVSSDAATVVV